MSPVSKQYLPLICDPTPVMNRVVLGDSPTPSILSRVYCGGHCSPVRFLSSLRVLTCPYAGYLYRCSPHWFAASSLPGSNTHSAAIRCYDIIPLTRRGLCFLNLNKDPLSTLVRFTSVRWIPLPVTAWNDSIQMETAYETHKIAMSRCVACLLCTGLAAFQECLVSKLAQGQPRSLTEFRSHYDRHWEVGQAWPTAARFPRSTGKRTRWPSSRVR